MAQLILHVSVIKSVRKAENNPNSISLACDSSCHGDHVLLYQQAKYSRRHINYDYTIALVPKQSTIDDCVSLTTTDSQTIRNSNVNDSLRGSRMTLRFHRNDSRLVNNEFCLFKD